ncbi:MAG: phosphonoacetaldehyde reductase [Planctomycetales bacterium]|nr:phosphonoacetaldehyde reductase [Planctomycetales bacterium]
MSRSLSDQPTRLSQLSELQNELAAASVRSIFVVADAVAFRESGAADFVQRIAASHAQVTLFQDFQANPQLEDAVHAASAFANSDADVIVAVGGGSAIDIAKLARSIATDNTLAFQQIRGTQSWQPDGRPFWAVPTTSGSGSEATQFAVVYAQGQKYSLSHPGLRANLVVLDAELTMSCPPRLTASCGLDALCQAVESMWSNQATEDSVIDAEQALRLAFSSLRQAVHAPNKQVRQAMIEAAHLAGRAIQVSKTTAPHALSYYLTSQFGIPHGFAVATNLVRCLSFNAEVSEQNLNEDRGLTHVRQQIQRIVEACGAATLTEAAERLNSLIVDVGGQTSIVGWDISNDQIPAIAASVNVQRLQNNPRKATSADLIRLLSD